MSRRAHLGATPETRVFLALGAAALAWLTLGGPTGGARGLVVVLALAVAVAGLPHGALDAWVARRAGLWRTPAGCVAFHVAYLGLAAAVVAAWRWAPGSSLTAFLAISAWHFAGDWGDRLPAWARAAAGAAVLALPAWRWPDEVAWAFGALSGADGHAIAAALSALAPWLAAGLLAAVIVALRRSATAALELGTVAVLALLLPPLAYFAIYFCGLHSLRHLRLAAAGVAPEARPRLVVVAGLYTGATVLAGAAAWPWVAALGAADWSTDTMRLVFIGLAALTLPHMLVVMHAERAQAGSR